MSTRVRQAFQSAAGAAGGAGLDVDEVFSTYLYTGNGDGIDLTVTQDIVNGIDLAGEGGLVWVKSRTDGDHHNLADTERGFANGILRTNETSTAFPSTYSINQANSDGFTVGAGTQVNETGHDYASWTFRKAPKFFDIVTYTGTGSNLTINHNLGSVPGCIIIKCTSAVKSWVVYHRGVNGGVNPEDYALFLNTTSAQNDNLYFQDTAPTSTQFFLGDSAANENGQTHVAYLFAHNDGDGEFGPDGDADIIKCGSYTGNGSADGPEIDLGFEPQWLIVKEASNGNSWFIIDAMRGINSNNDDNTLRANTEAAEGQSIGNGVRLTATGFKNENIYTGTNRNGSTYIYIAIRRGPLAVPESASDVFNVQTQGVNGYYGYLGKPVDLWINTEVSSGPILFRDRLRGGWYLLNQANTTEAQGGGDWYANNEGAFPTTNTSSMINWVWRRAPSFLDILAYRGSNSSLTLDHNLGVSPEMIWIKARNSPSSNDWFCWHKDLASIGDSAWPILSLTSNSGGYFNGNMTPTVSESSITIPSNVYISNASYEYISYMFATAPGVSKVGSYTGDGTTGRVIDCGFSTGARYIIIKRVAASGNWFIWDTTRGIVAGNDPYKLFNSQSAQNSSYDTVDPHNSGFIINQTTTNANVSGGKYIFYAIA